MKVILIAVAALFAILDSLVGTKAAAAAAVVVDQTRPQRLLDVYNRSSVMVTIPKKNGQKAVATIAIAVVVQDNEGGSGISHGRIVARFRSDVITSKDVYADISLNGSNSSGNSSSSNRAVTLDFVMALDASIRPGVYEFVVMVWDKAGNKATLDPYNKKNAQNRFMISKFKVVNAAFDTVKPVLLNFTVPKSYQTVNVTAAPVAVPLQLVVQDRSGVKSIDVTMTSALYDGSDDKYGIGAVNGYTESITFIPPIGVGGAPTVVNLTLNIPQFILTTSRFYLSVSMYDTKDNYLNRFQPRQNLQAPPSSSSSNPYSYIDVINEAEDLTEPEIVGLKLLTPSPFKVTTSNSSGAAVEMRLTVRDDLSGIVDLWVAAAILDFEYFIDSISCPNAQPDEPPGTGCMELRPRVDAFLLGSVNGGGKMDFNLTFPISRSTKPGVYQLVVWMRDANGNTATFNNATLAALKFPSSFEIVNTMYDTKPPVLTKAKLLSSATVDLSVKRSGTIDLQLFVQDEPGGSGFRDGTVVLFSSSSNSYVRNVPQVSFSAANGTTDAASKSLVVNARLRVPSFLASGAYSLQVTLNDVAGNQVVKNLSKRNTYPYLGSITIINAPNKTDTKPPELWNVTALSSLVLNVSSRPATASFQFVAWDALSGVSQWKVFLRKTNSYQFGQVERSGSFDVPVSGRPAVFNVSFTFARMARKGTYELDVILFDAANRQVDFYSSDIRRRGFPGQIQIV